MTTHIDPAAETTSRTAAWQRGVSFAEFLPTATENVDLWRQVWHVLVDLGTLHVEFSPVGAAERIAKLERCNGDWELRGVFEVYVPWDWDGWAWQ